MFELQSHQPVTYIPKQQQQQHPYMGYFGSPDKDSFCYSPEFGSPPQQQFVAVSAHYDPNIISTPTRQQNPPMGFGAPPPYPLFSPQMQQYHSFGHTPVNSYRLSGNSGRRYQDTRAAVTPTRSPGTYKKIHFATPGHENGGQRTQMSRAARFNSGSFGISDESRDDSINHSLDHSNRMPRLALPQWAIDSKGDLNATFEEILDNDCFELFVKDKPGCQYLQHKYPEKDDELRERLFNVVLGTNGLFEVMCTDVFANFFVQRMIEQSKDVEKEQYSISQRIKDRMFELCLNRYSCRVVQTALEMPEALTTPMLDELPTGNLVTLTIDQNANHVVQKIMNSFAPEKWAFIVRAFIVSEKAFFTVVENKYGCRVIQLAIELLSRRPAGKENRDRENGVKEKDVRQELLEGIMELLLNHCEQLSSNEFANYVIQHVIKDITLEQYRDLIIEKCLLCHLLSLSQEKFASHVVEKAIEFASPTMLKEMLDELFDGYVPHPETGRDAIDILLFHQFGNYVIQRVLSVCLSSTKLEQGLRQSWLDRLAAKIRTSSSRLQRYSSGKKIQKDLQEGLSRLNGIRSPLLMAVPRTRTTPTASSPINSEVTTSESVSPSHALSSRVSQMPSAHFGVSPPVKVPSQFR